MKAKWMLGGFLTLLMPAFSAQVPAIAGEKINVNTASVEQLEKVKGIDPSTAEAIVNYRKEHGPFSSLDEPVKLKGTGEKELKTLKASLTVDEKEEGKEEHKEHGD